MAYKNFDNANREKAMVQSYLLVKKFGIRQADVAKHFNCSQSTVSQWTKEIAFQEKSSVIEKIIKNEFRESEILSEKIKKYRNV